MLMVRLEVRLAHLTKTILYMDRFRCRENISKQTNALRVDYENHDGAYSTGPKCNEATRSQEGIITMPMVYAFQNIHKPNTSLQSIVTSIGSETKHLEEVSQPALIKLTRALDIHPTSTNNMISHTSFGLF